ncbi:MAG: hypothetical protein HRT90_05505 [Candidatus Margulisbacteria bacterium]|nr:hypothetical protein [Candidatus Margulisiibacteriota bacterium]
MRFRKYYVLILIFSLSTTCWGSGRYQFKNFGKNFFKIDPIEFRSGQKVFINGGSSAPELSQKDITSQQKLLQRINQKLTQITHNDYELYKLSGELTQDEFNALSYFLLIRYKINIPPENL